MTNKHQLYNIIAQKESKLGFQMAAEQRRLAHAAKRDSTSMKTLSLLGAIFLPATYLASVFSMTFFNFQNQDNGDNSGGSKNGNSGGSSDPSGGISEPVVSKDLWIYFVITIPLTLCVVLFWRWWDQRREKRYALEDADIETGIELMEQQIMENMRKRTMNKARTWGTDIRASPTWISDATKSMTG